MKKCPLCFSQAVLFTEFRQAEYYKCFGCSSVFLNPACRLGEEDERARYLLHRNHIDDQGYRSFVQPLVDVVLENYGPEHSGLDFGAGTGPVIAQMLNEKSYSIEIYDPFFHNNKRLLDRKYDYIIACEVIEHFYNPHEEFIRLASMLKPRGELICKTDFFYDELDFYGWSYKNDPTHVFFYHPMAFEFIKAKMNYSSLQLDGRIVRLVV